MGSFQDEADVFIVGKVVFRFQVAGLVGRFIKSRGLGIRQGDATFIKSRQKVFGRGEGSAHERQAAVAFRKAQGGPEFFRDMRHDRMQKS